MVTYVIAQTPVASSVTSSVTSVTNICKQREQYVPCGDGLGTVVNKKKLFSKKCIEKCFKKPFYPVVFRRFKCGNCP